MFSASLTLFCLIFELPSNKAYGWGSQGHSLATRVAIRLLIAKTNRNDKVMTPFQSKELMVAHLANIPDKLRFFTSFSSNLYMLSIKAIGISVFTAVGILS